MKLIKELQPNMDDASIWMGGEATLGPQAEDHVRWREQNVDGFPLVILSLAFGGGFALGSALCHLWRRSPSR
ncbi:MAG: hypothetical protein ICV75_02680 [Nitrospiraceae bacterium]|nr:hypothetical protein [Nitrospiraceae bacterium]